MRLWIADIAVIARHRRDRSVTAEAIKEENVNGPVIPNEVGNLLLLRF